MRLVAVTLDCADPGFLAGFYERATGDGGPTTYCGSWYSVWFSYTPTTDVHIAFDTLGSDYDTYFGVYYEDEFGWETAACSGDALGTLQSPVERDLPAGRTFLAGVAAEYRFGPPDPGTLDFHAAQVTPLTVTATVDSARLLTYGMAEVTGHLSCSHPATAGVTLELSQTLSRRSAHGRGQTSVDPCGNTTPFTVQVLPDAAPGTTGRATYTATAEAESLDVRSSSSTTGGVRLRNR
jgi:hypothetical protein